MTDAINQPVRRARREALSADNPVGQQAGDMEFPDDGLPDRRLDIEPVESLSLDQAALIAFNEEAITILIHPSQEKNPAIVVDCWVNGKGAEVFVGGGWHEFNCLPVGRPVTTKRKYVEALVRAKVTSVNTEHQDATVENPRNEIRRATASKAVFTVISDRNPQGAAWLARIMAEG